MQQTRATRAVRPAGRVGPRLALAVLLIALPTVRIDAQGVGGAAGGARAQTAIRGGTVVEHIAAGDRESAARRPAAALAHYEAALALDERHYVALGNASRELVDLGEVEKDETRRNALYTRAKTYAQRAVSVSPNDASGHFHLARALGRTALAVGSRERVKYALDIRTSALRAIALDARHAGALHIMGVWNAEIMRLNSVMRMMARRFMGAEAFSTASWAEATRYMEAAVAAEPNRLVHRLDLARVYRDTKRTADARAMYEAALKIPNADANDDVYRRAAETELRGLR